VGTGRGLFKSRRYFVLTENDLTADDEYEFFTVGTEVRVETLTDKDGNEFLGAVEAVSEASPVLMRH
jgi:hypothetical protein